MYRHGLVKLTNLKFYENVSGGYRNVSFRQADMTLMSLSVAFNTCYANEPNEQHRTRHH